MRGDRRIHYVPPGLIASRFLKSDAFICGLMGPIGSGKSTACVIKLLQNASMQPLCVDGWRRSRYAIVRNTLPMLKTTAKKTWHQWIPEHVGKVREQGPPMHHVIDPGNKLDMEVLFLGLDKPSDVKKVLSLELTGVWINECREVPKEIVDGLTGRVGRFKPNAALEPDLFSTNAQIIMDTNPPVEGHWYNLMAEEDYSTEVGRQLLYSLDESRRELEKEGVLKSGSRLWEFFRQPGGLAEGAENLRNLPSGYYRKAMAGKGDDWINVYVNGNYGYVKEGEPVYPEYVDSVHCRDFKLIPGLPILIGMDFGFWPAMICGQRTDSGQWRITSELVPSNVGTYRFAEMVKSHIAEYYSGYRIGRITGDPAGDSRSSSDKDERSTLQILKSVEIPVQAAPTNDPVRRHEAVKSALTRMVGGEPGYMVHPRCSVLRKAMSGGYCYRRVQVSGLEKYTQQPDKNKFSHPADAQQYLMLGGGEMKNMLTRGRKTGGVKFIRYGPSVPGVM